MVTKESLREYHKKYYQEKIKNKNQKPKEITFQIKRFIDGKWVATYTEYKK
jgi:hypothetical protein